MDGNQSSKRSDLIAEEAAEWVMALADGEDQTKRAFADWLRVSPEHVKEYLAVAGTWDALSRHPKQPTAEELVALAHAESNIVPMPGAVEDLHAGGSTEVLRPHGNVLFARRWMGLAAAVLVAVTAVSLVVFSRGDSNVHATTTAEQRSVPLPDGSLVTLNTRSTVRVDFSESHRDVHLAEGEALFDVAEDGGRPFRVITPSAVIQAVATEFNVRSSVDQVVVTVVEGVVDLSVESRGMEADPISAPSSPLRLRLEVGQRAQVGADAAEVVVVDVNVENAIAWRQHRLAFDSMPLKQVVEEFNRYNEPSATLADSELESLPISGVFRSNDRGSFFQFLRRMGLAEATIAEDGSVVLRRPTDDEPAP